MSVSYTSGNIKNVLICGKGEIGSAIGFIAAKRGFTVDYYDPQKGIDPEDRSDTNFEGYDVIHVCFPIKDVNAIYDVVNKSHMYGVIVIDATIPVGLAGKINDMFKDEGYGQLLLHSPVRGRHPNMVGGLRKYVKFVGPADSTRIQETEDFCKFYYTQLGIPYKVLSSADACALGKLTDTTWYLTQIVFANQISILCAKHNLNFDEVYTQFQETADTGVKFKNVEGRAICESFVPRPVMTPGFVGGHCLIPNLEILKQDISPSFYSWVKQMNEYFAGNINKMVESNADVKPLEHEGDRE